MGTAVTNGDGSYLFENRSAQVYTVVLTLLDGFRRMTPLEVTVTLASNDTVANSASSASRRNRRVYPGVD